MITSARQSRPEASQNRPRAEDRPSTLRMGAEGLAGAALPGHATRSSGSNGDFGLRPAARRWVRPRLRPGHDTARTSRGELQAATRLVTAGQAGQRDKLRGL